MSDNTEQPNQPDATGLRKLAAAVMLQATAEAKNGSIDAALWLASAEAAAWAEGLNLPDDAPLAMAAPLLLDPHPPKFDPNKRYSARRVLEASYA